MVINNVSNAVIMVAELYLAKCCLNERKIRFTQLTVGPWPLSKFRLLATATQSLWNSISNHSDSGVKMHLNLAFRLSRHWILRSNGSRTSSLHG